MNRVQPNAALVSSPTPTTNSHIPTPEFKSPDTWENNPAFSPAGPHTPAGTVWSQENTNPVFSPLNKTTGINPDNKA